MERGGDGSTGLGALPLVRLQAHDRVGMRCAQDVERIPRTDGSQLCDVALQHEPLARRRAVVGDAGEGPHVGHGGLVDDDHPGPNRPAAHDGLGEGSQVHPRRTGLMPRSRRRLGRG